MGRGVPTIQFGSVITTESKGLRRVDSWNEVYNIIQEMYS